MSWSYRIVKHLDDHSDWFAIHEAYDDGASCTVKPVEFIGESPEEIRKSLQMALNDCNREIIVVDDRKEATTCE